MEEYWILKQVWQYHPQGKSHGTKLGAKTDQKDPNHVTATADDNDNNDLSTKKQTNKCRRARAHTHTP